ncbi:MAG: DNA primase [Candidatus Schekmanbacteria bacterium]|nr:MAG: DNA primase [Candidatus Schekmanbacteria bacterium]
MLVDNSKIDEIRRTADIVDVISDYVSLVRAGRNFKGLCPFHSEKTPSFIVSPEKEIFHCFGCGAGGNVFTFLMRYENLSFPDAVRFLAKRYGITLTFSKREKDKETLDLFYQINEDAKRFFCSNLHTRVGSQALSYLKNRGFDDAIIQKFEIGYAPDDWESLTLFLRKKYKDSEILKSGLVVGREEGKGFYDRFRNRIIFPIVDRYERTVGFGGRIMEEEGGAKYINSPETPIFKKSKILYGFPYAKDEIRKKRRVFITEGYIDVIMAYKFGFKEIVAPLGTALTDEHLRIMELYADNVYFVFDADKAGIDAVIRAWEKICKTKLSSKVIVLPQGEDLDSALRKKGKEEIEKFIENAQDTGEFVISKIIGNFDLTSAGEKKKALNRVFELLSSLLDEFNFAVYASFLANRLKIDEGIIVDAYKNIKKTFKSFKKKTNEKYSFSNEKDKTDVLEYHLLMIALLSEEWTKRVFDIISPDRIEDATLRKIALKLNEIANKKGIDELEIVFQQEGDSGVINKLTELRLKGEELVDVEKSFNDCIKMFQRREIERKLENNKILIEKAVKSGNQTEIDVLLKENQKLQASVKGNLMTST